MKKVRSDIGEPATNPVVVEGTKGIKGLDNTISPAQVVPPPLPEIPAPRTHARTHAHVASAHGEVKFLLVVSGPLSLPPPLSPIAPFEHAHLLLPSYSRCVPPRSQVGEQVKTAFAEAAAASHTSPALSNATSAMEAQTEKYKMMLEESTSANKDLARQMEAMRLEMVKLTSMAAKFEAESAMKDQHILLLKVDIATYRAAARDESSAAAWDHRQLWAHGRDRTRGGGGSSGPGKSRRR